MRTGKNIHVLVIPAWLPTDDNPFGGIFILDQARAIQQYTPVTMGFIYRQDFSLSKRHHVLPDALTQFQHVVVTKPYTPKVNTATINLWCNQYMDAYRQYEKEHGAPDIIHAHSYVAGFVAQYIFKKSGIPFVLTEHLTSFIDQSINKAHTPTLKKVLDHASTVIAVSTLLRKALSSYTTRTIDVIPNLYDEEVFRPSAAAKKNEFSVVAIGDLIPRKGFDLLIDAFKIACDQDNELRLDIVGTGEEMSDLEQRIGENDLTLRVTLRGARSSKEIATILQSSDLCISTSHAETFGITLIEAMGCGIPIVATPSGGPQEIVTNQTGIITRDRDPSTIAAAIIEVMESGDYYKPEIISEHARQNYGSKIISQKLYGIYQIAVG